MAHVAEHETGVYEPRGAIIGRLQATVLGQSIDYSNTNEVHRTPRWVEADAVQFHSLDAEGVLIIENEPLFVRLAKAAVWDRSRLLLVTGSGLPRAGMRRFLHRLTNEFRKPLHVLADCDTWGYFLASLLKRGVVDPRDSLSYLAVPEARFLGLRAGSDVSGASRETTRAWKSHWSERLRHLRAYPCFQTTEWQAEFDELERRRQALSLRHACESLGVEETVRRFIVEPIQNQTWLA